MVIKFRIRAPHQWPRLPRFLRSVPIRASLSSRFLQEASAQNPLNQIRYRRAHPIELLGYGFGTMAGGISSGLFGSTLFKFWTDPNWMGISAGFYVLTMAIFAVWNAINDPLAGMLIDNTQTRFGRFIPYLRFGGPLLGLSFMLLWIPPKIIPNSILSWYLLAILLLYDTIYTIVIVAKCGILNRMSLDYRERSRINFIATIFSAVGVAVSFLIPNAFLINPGTESMRKFTFTMIIIGIIVILSFLFMSFAIKEVAVKEYQEKQLSLFTTFWIILKNPAFLCYILFDFFHVLTINILTSNTPNYLEFVFQDQSDQVTIFFICAFSGGIIGLFILLQLSQRFNLRAVLLFSTAVYSLGGFCLYFANFNLLRHISIFIMGMGILGPLIFLDPLMSDIIDDDMWRTRINRAGNYIGTAALFSKPAHLVGNVLALQILVPATYQLPNDLRNYTALANASGTIIGLIPGIAMAICFLAIFIFPLRGAKYQLMKQELQERINSSDLALN